MINEVLLYRLLSHQFEFVDVSEHWITSITHSMQSADIPVMGRLLYGQYSFITSWRQAVTFPHKNMDMDAESMTV